MPLKSIYKKTRNPMEGMGSMPPGYASMGMAQGGRNSQPRLPNWYTQKWRSLAQPQPHTPYGPTIPGRKLKVRGRAVLDANPYRSALKALQRGTNRPIALIGGEVGKHGASRESRQDKRAAQDRHEVAQLRKANFRANAAILAGQQVAPPRGIEGDGVEGNVGKKGKPEKPAAKFGDFFKDGPSRGKGNSWSKRKDYLTERAKASPWGQFAQAKKAWQQERQKKWDEKNQRKRVL